MKLPPVDGKARFTGRPQDIHGIAVNVPGKSFTKERRQSSRKCRLKPGQVTRETSKRPPFKIKFPVRRGKGSIWPRPPPLRLYIRCGEFHETKSKRFFKNNTPIRIFRVASRVILQDFDIFVRIPKQNFYF